jgi:hypothetical protein
MRLVPHCEKKREYNGTLCYTHEDCGLHNLDTLTLSAVWELRSSVHMEVLSRTQTDRLMCIEVATSSC